jgi:hypothetical protein
VQQLADIARTLTLKKWMERLEESSKERRGAIIETNPAVKLLDFFRLMSQKEARPEALSQYEVKSLVSDSRTAAKLEAMKPEWIQFWMSEWNK